VIKSIFLLYQQWPLRYHNIGDIQKKVHFYLCGWILASKFPISWKEQETTTRLWSSTDFAIFGDNGPEFSKQEGSHSHQNETVAASRIFFIKSAFSR